MKQKKIRFITLILLGLGFTGIQAQYKINVKAKLGGQTSISLTDLRKIAFKTDRLILNTKDGTSLEFALKEIGLLYFNSDASEIQSLMKEDGKILLFPNPVLNVLSISNPISDLQNIDIIDVQGRIVKSIHQIEESHQIKVDLINIPKGIYLCRLKSSSKTETRKFIKN